MKNLKISKFQAFRAIVDGKYKSSSLGNVEAIPHSNGYRIRTSSGADANFSVEGFYNGDIRFPKIQRKSLKRS